MLNYGEYTREYDGELKPESEPRSKPWILRLDFFISLEYILKPSNTGSYITLRRE